MQVNSIRNPDGHWINTSAFNEAARHFDKYGYYCEHPWNSYAWREYWDEELKRCIYGYSTGGAHITGNHYFYLNYARIKLLDKRAKQVDPFEKLKKKFEGVSKLDRMSRRGNTKKEFFPDFWDYDYNFFHALDIARYGSTPEEVSDLQLAVTPLWLDGGHHMVVGKTRRRGYSYKSAAIGANAYNSVRGALIGYCAYLEDHLIPDGTLKMCFDNIDWLTQNTAWAKKRDRIDQGDYREASFEERVRGVKSFSGYKSAVRSFTFKDKPGKARGKDFYYAIFEEMGEFLNSLESIAATRPAMEEGVYSTGQILAFGTAGVKDSAGMERYSTLFYNPEPYNFMPFVNIWDTGIPEGSTCGMFVPDFCNKVGFMDEQGNSDTVKAMEYEQQVRDYIENEADDPETLGRYKQEYPFMPSEAFQGTETTYFPAEEIKQQLNKVKNTPELKKSAIACNIFRDTDGVVKIQADLEGKLIPISSFKGNKGASKKGCLMVEEMPDPNAPRGLYKIGYDPVRQNQGTSYTAVYVYKSDSTFSYTRNKIVAWYVGRPRLHDDANRIVEYLCEAYNAIGHCMHENEVLAVRSYFENVQKLHYLAASPEHVISKHIKKSRVNRVWGIHMTSQLKDAGEKYITKWLLQVRNILPDGTKVLNLHTITDIGLLEELLAYNRKDSDKFDRIMAFMMIMFLIDEEHGKQHTRTKDKSSVLKALKANAKNLFAGKKKFIYGTRYNQAA